MAATAAENDDDNSMEQLQQLSQGQTNTLELFGNKTTMNLNSMILTNIQASPYFKVQLYELKTFHEVVDEVYYKVDHLEPWERGSRKTQGLSGMSGGVRGVGAGGIVSTAYCLLYKFFTLRLTRKQLKGLLDHTDSPYIRAVGFMYIRYCLPPADLWDWYEPYFEDEEEIDVKAGSGCTMTIGEMLLQWLSKLDWYGTLFPRIPVPIQKKIEVKLRERRRSGMEQMREAEEETEGARRVLGMNQPESAAASSGSHHREKEKHRSRSRSKDKHRDKDHRDRHGHGGDRHRDGHSGREKERHGAGQGYSGDRHHHRQSSRDRERGRDDHRQRDHHRSRDHDREGSFERDLRREKNRHHRH